MAKEVGKWSRWQRSSFAPGSALLLLPSFLPQPSTSSRRVQGNSRNPHSACFEEVPGSRGCKEIVIIFPINLLPGLQWPLCPAPVLLLWFSVATWRGSKLPPILLSVALQVRRWEQAVPCPQRTCKWDSRKQMLKGMLCWSEWRQLLFPPVKYTTAVKGRGLGQVNRLTVLIITQKMCYLGTGTLQLLENFQWRLWTSARHNEERKGRPRSRWEISNFKVIQIAEISLEVYELVLAGVNKW